MEAVDSQNGTHAESEDVSFASFLESLPPNRDLRVAELWEQQQPGSPNAQMLMKHPEIRLHCENPDCAGNRVFRSISERAQVSNTDLRFAHLKYQCTHCQNFTKVYSLSFTGLDNRRGYVMKLGEFPASGPPVPAKLAKLLGQDRETFLKGRRCESQGLGIGAYVYYRRVIEMQRARILGKVRGLSEQTGAPKKTLETLDAAIEETEFSKSLDMVKDIFPDFLLIDGLNPMTLLRSAWSEGLNGRGDDECLQIAGSIRIVLAELSERLALPPKNEAELKNALSTLMRLDKS